VKDPAKEAAILARVEVLAEEALAYQRGLTDEEAHGDTMTLISGSLSVLMGVLLDKRERVRQEYASLMGHFALKYGSKKRGH
jgi:hypothetical protein